LSEMDIDQLSIVVPANAGTHNPGRSLWGKVSTTVP